MVAIAVLVIGVLATGPRPAGGASFPGTNGLLASLGPDGVSSRGRRRRLASGWESRTPTEVDVVQLVSEGLTNPAVAEKRLVSRGTVKVHLAHIFTKLGMASRTELAAEAALRRRDDIGDRRTK